MVILERAVLEERQGPVPPVTTGLLRVFNVCRGVPEGLFHRTPSCDCRRMLSQFSEARGGWATFVSLLLFLPPSLLPLLSSCFRALCWALRTQARIKRSLEVPPRGWERWLSKDLPVAPGRLSQEPGLCHTIT